MNHNPIKQLGNFTDKRFMGRNSMLYWPGYDSWEKEKTLNLDFLESNLYW